MQDAQVLEVPFEAAVRRLDGVVCAAEDDRREHLLAVDVAREPSWLSHERPDDVAVVDAMVVSSAQALARELPLVSVPDLELALEEADLDPLAHEARGD